MTTFCLSRAASILPYAATGIQSNDEVTTAFQHYLSFAMFTSQPRIAPLHTTRVLLTDQNAHYWFFATSCGARRKSNLALRSERVYYAVLGIASTGSGEEPHYDTLAKWRKTGLRGEAFTDTLQYAGVSIVSASPDLPVDGEQLVSLEADGLSMLSNDHMDWHASAQMANPHGTSIEVW